MAIKYYSKLTHWLVDQYGHRKGFGIISFLYDVSEKKFIPVPCDKEHAAFLAKLLGIDKEGLKFSERAQKFIPVNIQIDADGSVKGLLTGVSGLEIGFKLRHERRYIRKAHRMAISLIKHGELPRSPDFKDKALYKYAR